MRLSVLPRSIRSPPRKRRAPPGGGSIERLKLGNLEALGELYDRHHAAVRAFACRLVGDAASAEDLVHEVFLSIPNAIRNFKGDSSLRTFLIAIAVNMSRHHVRAATRRRGAIERMSREPVSSGGRRPRGLRHARRGCNALVRALDELSHDHRVAFVLCEVEERSSAEVDHHRGARRHGAHTSLSR